MTPRPTVNRSRRRSSLWTGGSAPLLWSPVPPVDKGNRHPAPPFGSPAPCGQGCPPLLGPPSSHMWTGGQRRTRQKCISKVPALWVTAPLLLWNGKGRAGEMSQLQRPRFMTNARRSNTSENGEKLRFPPPRPRPPPPAPRLSIFRRSFSICGLGAAVASQGYQKRIWDEQIRPGEVGIVLKECDTCYAIAK